MGLVAFSLTGLIFHWRMKPYEFPATLTLSLLVEPRKCGGVWYWKERVVNARVTFIWSGLIVIPIFVVVFPFFCAAIMP